MKLIKTASGKETIKISKKEWIDIGKKHGWMRTALWQETDDPIKNEIHSLLDEVYKKTFNADQEVKNWTKEKLEDFLLHF